MGLFGFGKKSVSNNEIDNVVMSHLHKLGNPKDIGQKAHDEKFIEMLNELDQWAVSLGFGDWKRSAICGSIEGSLRKTYRNCGVDDHVSTYIKMMYKIIMKT